MLLMLIFYMPYVYAQEDIETWNLTIEESYEIPISAENLIIDYIRAEQNNSKILMYVTVENSENNSHVEFKFPSNSVREIFGDDSCVFGDRLDSTEFLLRINQKMQDSIKAEKTNDVLHVVVPLSSNSSHVEILVIVLRFFS